MHNLIWKFLKCEYIENYNTKNRKNLNLKRIKCGNWLNDLIYTSRWLKLKYQY